MHEEWLEEKAALGPVFLINAKGFSAEQAVDSMLETKHWNKRQLNSKLGKIVVNIVELAADGYYLTPIAKELGIDKSGLRRFCEKLGIHVDSPPCLDDIEEELVAYIDEGLSTVAIAENTGFSVTSITRWIKRNGFVKKNSYHNGFIIAKGKYICIPAKDHPEANGKGYVRLHRLMAEKMLGRYLKPDEDVHHKDGNSFNNNPDNLQVLSREEHTKLHNQQGDNGWGKYHSNR